MYIYILAYQRQTRRHSSCGEDAHVFLGSCKCVSRLAICGLPEARRTACVPAQDMCTNVISTGSKIRAWIFLKNLALKNKYYFACPRHVAGAHSTAPAKFLPNDAKNKVWSRGTPALI